MATWYKRVLMCNLRLFWMLSDECLSAHLWNGIILFFVDVIVVVNEAMKSEVQAALEHTGLKIHFEVLGIPIGEDWGTADTLRFLYDTNKIKVCKGVINSFCMVLI